MHTFDEDIKRQPISAFRSSRHGTTRKRKSGVERQRGGIAPFLAAAIPGLVEGGKAAALGGLGAAAKYGTTIAIRALEKQKYKRRRRSKKRN